ncbi:MAG TPA: YaaL family protein [Virgibacillus sp.]|nr:YaaL family protein [Virgibacillus sp.]
MSRKVNKSMVDQQLLNAIVTLESEWKYIQSILENSIEPGENILYKQDLAEAKYLYLLREARNRKISAVRFPQY